MKTITKIACVSLLLINSCSASSNHYQEIFAKPHRQNIGLGITGLASFFSARSLMRSFRNRQPAVAIASVAFLGLSTFGFWGIEKSSSTPVFITNKRFPSFAKQGEGLRTTCPTNTPAHDAVHGIAQNMHTQMDTHLKHLATMLDETLEEALK